MSNPNSPFGFRESTAIDGATTNYGVGKGLCLAGASAMGKGDPLIITNGYLSAAPAQAGGVQFAGVMISATWVSTAEGKRVWKEFYPGNDSVNNADVTIHFIAHPNSIFEIQPLNGGALGAITQASVGKFANVSAGAGGAATTGGHWKSTYALDDTTINAVQGSLPLKIVALEQQPNTDPTSAFNLLRVQLVNLNAGV